MTNHHVIGRATSLALALLVAAGCAATPPEQVSLPATAAPSATAAPTAPPSATAEPPATATLAPAPTPAPTTAPRQPYAGTLDLVPVEKPLDTCPQPSPLSL